jgi:AcrR family transcriptional regulator
MATNGCDGAALAPGLGCGPNAREVTENVAARRTKAGASGDGTKPGALVRGEPVVRGVLAATLAELGRTGYGALRIEDVAERAGVNKTTIYRRWPTKEELVLAALESVITDEHRAPIETGSLRGDLIELGRRALKLLQSPKWRGLLKVVMAEGPNSELKAIARSLREARSSHPLENASSKRELAPGVEPRLVEGLLGSFLLHRVLADQEPVDDALLERVVDVLLYGVLRRDAPAADAAPVALPDRRKRPADRRRRG